MLILGIETSCDDTAIAVMEIIIQNSRLRQGSGGQAKAIKVLSSIVSSQLAVHSPYGGVVPRLAAREHEKNLPIVLAQALTAAKTTIAKIDLIAVTAGPGLAPSLWRGVEFVNTLAKKENKPLVATNHMLGHIYSNFLAPVGKPSILNPIGYPLYPILNLIVSGGHTELVLQSSPPIGGGKLKKIGATLDDAAGEAFDKVARLLGLGFPGGPEIAAEAAKFQSASWRTKSKILNIKLPRPMLHSKDFNFSFSGLKTAVLYWLRDHTPKKPSAKIVSTLCHEFQSAVIEVLVSKTVKAAEKYKVKTVALSGGVSANRKLRETLEETLKTTLPKVNFMKPELCYTGDNGAMIALAGYVQFQISNLKFKINPQPVQADANWEIV